jgi:predicted acylesterase/phospholipase RssA
MFPRRIYLCGGGVNTISHVGALEYLEEYGYLRNIKEWMGISAGALYAMCLAIGYTVSEVREFCLKFNFQEITDPDIASGWLVNLGFDTGNRLQRLINALLRETGLDDMVTFQELGNLRVYATNINTGKLEEFSASKSPTYPVAYAVRASMTLPYYFQPFTCPLTNQSYVDGGVITNYPLGYMTESDRQDTLGLFITYTMNVIETMSLQEFMTRPIHILVQTRSHTDYSIYPNQTINCILPSSSPVEFDMPLTKKIGLMELSYAAAKEFFKGFRKPVRRYSIA